MAENMGALRTDRGGDVLGARTRTRPWKKAVRQARAQRSGSGERNRTRIRYQAPWQRGLAVGSGAGEGACQQVMHRRFTRAGMRWKPPGVLTVLA